MSRLTLHLVVLLAALLPGFSFAETPPAPGTYVAVTVWYAPVGSNYYYNVGTFCEAYVQVNAGTGYHCANGRVSSTVASQLSQTWAFDRVDNTGKVNWSYTAQAQAYCDPKYFSGPTTDPAAPGVYKCKVVTSPPAQCPAGQVSKGRQDYGTDIKSAGGAFPDHINNCNIEVTEVTYCGQYVATGKYFCDYVVKFTGGLYGGPMTPPQINEAPPDPSNRSSSPNMKNPGHIDCPKGSVQAGTDSDGVTPICVGTGSAPDNPKDPPKTTTSPSQTTTNADGSTTATQVSTQQNSDGSTTTTTTTTVTGVDGTKTVTVNSNTSNNSAGSAGKVDTPSEPSDLCKQHPELTMCRNSSVSGSCGQIACIGDAVQCATLRAAAQMQCNQQADIDAMKARPELAEGTAILSGADPMQSQITDLVKGTEVDMSAPKLDQAGFVGGGACIPSKTFSVMGKSVTVDFAGVCSNILPLRAVFMALAFIVSYLIVARSVLQA